MEACFGPAVQRQLPGARVLVRWRPWLSRLRVAQQFLGRGYLIEPRPVGYIAGFRLGRRDARRLRWVCARVRVAFFPRRLTADDILARPATEAASLVNPNNSCGALCGTSVRCQLRFLSPARFEPVASPDRATSNSGRRRRAHIYWTSGTCLRRTVIRRPFDRWGWLIRRVRPGLTRAYLRTTLTASTQLRHGPRRARISGRHHVR